MKFWYISRFELVYLPCLIFLQCFFMYMRMYMCMLVFPHDFRLPDIIFGVLKKTYVRVCEHGRAFNFQVILQALSPELYTFWKNRTTYLNRFPTILGLKKTNIFFLNSAIELNMFTTYAPFMPIQQSCFT